MQCGILARVLEQKNGISGNMGGIRIEVCSVVNSTVLTVSWFGSLYCGHVSSYIRGSWVNGIQELPELSLQLFCNSKTISK